MATTKKISGKTNKGAPAPLKTGSPNKDKQLDQKVGIKEGSKADLKRDKKGY